MATVSGKSWPDFQLEKKYWAQHCAVVGVDEAGRGCVAGPIVAAAVVVSPGTRRTGFWRQVNDSKKIPSLQRLKLAFDIEERSLGHALAWVSAIEVDELGINCANRVAMERAVRGLPVISDILLADWISTWPLRLQKLVQIRVAKGDCQHLSIAAASILAKVHRDRYMSLVHEKFPQYGFGQHKGYLTRAHALAITEFGPCSEHRFSFRPLRGAYARRVRKAD